MRTEFAAVVAVGIVTAVSPGIAQAANVTAPEPAAGSPRVLTYAAVAGETNQPTFTREGGQRRGARSVGDARGGGALHGALDTVVCPDAPTRITQLAVTLDDLPDTAVVDITDVTTSINGGAGKDSITGSDGGADAIDGAGDEDTVNGRGGDDRCSTASPTARPPTSSAARATTC